MREKRIVTAHNTQNTPPPTAASAAAPTTHTFHFPLPPWETFIPLLAAQSSQSIRPATIDTHSGRKTSSHPAHFSFDECFS